MPPPRSQASRTLISSSGEELACEEAWPSRAQAQSSLPAAPPAARTSPVSLPTAHDELRGGSPSTREAALWLPGVGSAKGCRDWGKTRQKL